MGGGVDEDDSEEGSAIPTKGRQQAGGLKVAYIDCRTGDPWVRVMLDFDACSKGLDEMVFFHESMDTLTSLLPGMTGSVWDGAAFGKDAECHGRTHGRPLMSKVNLYRVETPRGKGTIRLRMFNDDEDDRRRINRSQHLRSIPEGDPDFVLYGLRNDAESINEPKNSDASGRIANSPSSSHTRDSPGWPAHNRRNPLQDLAADPPRTPRKAQRSRRWASARRNTRRRRHEHPYGRHFTTLHERNLWKTAREGPLWSTRPDVYRYPYRSLPL